MSFFTPTERWELLGPVRRITRICRIVCGCLLLSSLLLPLRALYAAPGVPPTTTVILAACIVLLGWVVGRMFIWRPVHPSSKPEARGTPPTEPPSEGAPRLAPLRPVSPLILSAHAEIPKP